MGTRVGVLAIQGDFACHLKALYSIGASALEVRTAEELDQCSHLIIPGGESTTVGKLLQRFGLGEEIQSRARARMPIWGTCMGMIMMAARVEDSEQYSLGLLDITVKRNAFGRQVHSFEAPVQVEGVGEVTAVFIRAPVVTDVGSTQAIATFDGQVVAVRQDNLLGTSFHPELTGDTRLHEWFIKEIGSAQRG
ncbi:MAG: pyridoxal 5'-phosphate synthase glutaminase subunit PdxT [Chthonomonas sp.]|nr:pyridoxal 5'-phosphate synthase glutaminase subunit PdxT [Chthonomonas sp.]